MGLIALYSFLLLGGIGISQAIDLTAVRDILSVITTACLAYIMIEVGLGFHVDKTRLKSYGWDFCVAMTAASLPWILWIVYFIVFFGMPYKEAFLVGLSTAPTSAGVLFAMLAAAGLGTSWLFGKARVLAVFDDIGTIFLLIGVKILLIGAQPQLAAIVVIIGALLFAAYRWLHQFKIPSGQLWLIFYSILLVAFIAFLEKAAHIHLEVLLPAFVLGCVIYHAHTVREEKHLEPFLGWKLIVDRLIKGSFMFLVGASLPKVEMAEHGISTILLHVLALTVLANIGKCFPILCYRKEATFKERVALGIAMFPRGEVGAGVLLITLAYGFGGIGVAAAILSLALNLLLTGIFIYFVVKLLNVKEPGLRAV